MAEVALIASIVQIADTGYRLSLKLYTSGEAISSADRAILAISKDISLTSTVLKELGEILGRDEDQKERICSETLVQTAGNTVKECLDVFEELDKMILKNIPNLSQGHRATRATMALEKLKWPFIQPRIQLLRGSLDMLRANISLMLNVLIYARHVSERKKSRAPAPDVYDEAGQKTLIEELASSKEEYVRRFESLKISSHTTQNMPDIGSRPTPVHKEGNVGPIQHSFYPLPRATFENAPAPQWPLPNIPASYPIASMDPMTVQSDQYNFLGLLRHFDILVDNLIREIYSPEYQIPGESRSRFTGAIRETQRSEVIEAERRESTWSVASPRLTHYALPASKSTVHAYKAPSVTGKPRRREPKRRRLENEEKQPVFPQTLDSADSPGDLVGAGYSRDNKAHGQVYQCSWDEKQKYGLVLKPSGGKPERIDVVDDLVRLWTLVR